MQSFAFVNLGALPKLSLAPAWWRGWRKFWWFMTSEFSLLAVCRTTWQHLAGSSPEGRGAVLAAFHPRSYAPYVLRLLFEQLPQPSPSEVTEVVDRLNGWKRLRDLDQLDPALVAVRGERPRQYPAFAMLALFIAQDLVHEARYIEAGRKAAQGYPRLAEVQPLLARRWLDLSAGLEHLQRRGGAVLSGRKSSLIDRPESERGDESV